MNHNLLSVPMTAIIKVVGDACNIKCKYCFYYLNHQSKIDIMPDWLLEQFVVEYLQMHANSRNIVFIWHGGEPLLAGIEFYKKAVRYQNRHKKATQYIRNSMQTNGTLINDEWAMFFKQNSFSIGVSVDGCEESHNRHRLNNAGHGSFSSVMKGVATLKKHGISHGVIQTLTKSNLGNLKKDYDFFVNTMKQKTLALNHFCDDGNSNISGESVSPEELTEYYKKFIDLHSEKNNGVISREFDCFVAAAVGKCGSNCSYNGKCAMYFCIEHDGRVYPCDRLAGRDEYFFGNFTQNSLVEILQGYRRYEYAKAVMTLPQSCENCEWKKSCHNGCTHHRAGGPSGKYIYCETRMEIFSYMKNKINN